MRRSRRVRHEDPEDIQALKKKIEELESKIEGFEDAMYRMEQWRMEDQSTIDHLHEKFKYYKFLYLSTLDEVNKKMTE